MSAVRELAVVVPVMVNFKGLAELLCSVDYNAVPIIYNNWDFNHGVAKAWNDGLRIAMKRNIGNVLIVNDDITFEPGTISKMMNSMYTQPFVSALNKRDFTPATTESYDDEPDFSCFMVHPKQFTNRLGFFDENFYPAYFEDNDMGYRMRLAGWLANTRRLDAPVFHKGSVTQNWDGGMTVSSPQFEKNRLYYRTKWGGVPGQEQYKTPFGQGGSIKDW